MPVDGSYLKHNRIYPMGHEKTTNKQKKHVEEKELIHRYTKNYQIYKTCQKRSNQICITNTNSISA